MIKFVRAIIPHPNINTQVMCVFQIKWNIWVIPGGVIESNESPEQALIREISEELNIICEIFELRWHDEIEFNNIKYIGYYFLIKKYSGNLR